MNIVFYITNHGFGHASRNVPIIEELLKDANNHIFIRSDNYRCDFMRKNLMQYDSRIEYLAGYGEVGLILEEDSMEVSVSQTQSMIEQDLGKWPEYIELEEIFLKENRIDVVVSDTAAWVLKAANKCNIPSMLIGNFSWAHNYESIGIPKELIYAYEEAYGYATKSIWYTPHDSRLNGYTVDSSNVSMISRDKDEAKIRDIRDKYDRPIVFVSLGASAKLSRNIDVSDLPYEFIYTRGINLIGENTHLLKEGTINTPDYIAASDYILIKGGWSTLAEVMIQGKRCALLLRPGLNEDRITREFFVPKDQCLVIIPDDLYNIQNVIDKLDTLNPETFDGYVDDREKICREIRKVKNDSTWNSRML